MTILIVEDEHIEQQALKKMLEKLYPHLEMTILFAMDGVQAVQMARLHNPAILFMDIQLPLKDGLQAAHEIRQFNTNALLVMVTAYSEFEYARKALRNDTFDYLVKPYSLKTFQAMMDRLLEKLDEIQAKTKHLNHYGKLQELLQREFMQKLFLGPPLSSEKIIAYGDSLNLGGKVFQCCIWSCNNSLDPAIEQRFEYFLSEQGISFMKETFQNLHYLLLSGHSLDSLRPIQALLDSNRLFTKEGPFLFSNLLTEWEQLGSEFQQLLMKLPIKPVGTPSPELTVLSLADAILSNDSIVLNFHAEALLSQVLQLHIHGASYRNKLFEYLLAVIKQVYSIGDIQASSIYNQIGSGFGMQKSTSDEEIGVEFTIALRLFHTYYLSNVQTQNERLLLQVKQYIHQHFHLPLSLDELAQEVQMSTSYLSRTFKNLEGINLKDYILNVKLDHAKQFLLSGMSVEASSAETGFSDPAYFSKCFKRETGMTPREFAQTRRKF